MGFRYAAPAVVCACLAAAACGGSDGPTDPSPGGGNPVQTTTLTISSTGVSPRSIVVSRGSQVTIRNDDARNHDMTSDPHPTHTDCTELNAIGFLTPGQSKQSGNLNTVRTCGIHDHLLPESNSLKATVTIQ
jgi:hypothetical protein